MIDFIICEPITGRILGTGQCPNNMVDMQKGDNEILILGKANESLHYFDFSGPSPVRRDKVPLPISINKMAVTIGEEVVISGIPIGTRAEVDGDVAIINDGTLEMTFDTFGEYTITLELFPYLDWKGTIICA